MHDFKVVIRLNTDVMHAYILDDSTCDNVNVFSKYEKFILV